MISEDLKKRVGLLSIYNYSEDKIQGREWNDLG